MIAFNEELAEQLRYMMQLEGWKYVEQQRLEKIQYHTELLLSCPLDKVIEHRNMIECLKWLPATIDEAMQDQN